MPKVALFCKKKTRARFLEKCPIILSWKLEVSSKRANHWLKDPGGPLIEIARSSLSHIPRANPTTCRVATLKLYKMNHGLDGRVEVSLQRCIMPPSTALSG